MDRIFTPPPQRRPTTQAADGLPRWRWTVAEIEKMAVNGYFREDERFELVGGEIVPMSPKGRRHEIIRGKLALRLSRQTQDDIFIVSEPQFNLADDTYLHPDILIKSSTYAIYGVREYWVINAVTLCTMVHRQPSGKSWGFVDEVAPAGTLTPSRLPAFAVSLGALRLD